MTDEYRPLTEMAGKTDEGMRCPVCQCPNFTVYRTRKNGRQQTKEREIRCRNCGTLFLSRESIVRKLR